MSIISRFFGRLKDIFTPKKPKEDLNSLINRLFDEGKIIRSIARKTREGIPVQIVTLKVERRCEPEFNLLQLLRQARLVLNYNDSKEISCLIRSVSQGETCISLDLQLAPEVNVFKGGIHIPDRIVFIASSGESYEIQ